MSQGKYQVVLCRSARVVRYSSLHCMPKEVATGDGSKDVTVLVRGVRPGRFLDHGRASQAQRTMHQSVERSYAPGIPAGAVSYGNVAAYYPESNL